jgi:hypothetical protein
MLGDKIGEESGQVIGTRVLASDTGPKMETTIQMQGSLLGVETNDTATLLEHVAPRRDALRRGKRHRDDG